ncbi:MAG: hypothetical protein U9N59_10420 [Campylobacterota bacterium]|nr:hypothetical protein [Campylobacterota bacterium]
MKKTISLAVITALNLGFSGCSSVVMEYIPGQAPSKYAPLNEQDNSHGLISYSGEDDRVEAYQKMHKQCDGKYNIINESLKRSGSVWIVTGKTTGYASPRYKTFIKFKCMKK